MNLRLGSPSKGFSHLYVDGAARQSLGNSVRAAPLADDGAADDEQGNVVGTAPLDAPIITTIVDGKHDAAESVGDISVDDERGVAVADAPTPTPTAAASSTTTTSARVAALVRRLCLAFRFRVDCDIGEPAGTPTPGVVGRSLGVVGRNVDGGR